MPRSERQTGTRAGGCSVLALPADLPPARVDHHPDEAASFEAAVSDRKGASPTGCEPPPTCAPYQRASFRTSRRFAGEHWRRHPNHAARNVPKRPVTTRKNRNGFGFRFVWSGGVGPVSRPGIARLGSGVVCGSVVACPAPFAGRLRSGTHHQTWPVGGRSWQRGRFGSFDGRAVNSAPTPASSRTTGSDGSERKTGLRRTPHPDSRPIGRHAGR